MVDTSFIVIAYDILLIVLFIPRSPIESVDHVAVGLNAVLTAIVCDVSYYAYHHQRGGERVLMI